ncbi:retrotransposon protein, putative, ty1-copia subclass [Tanacetum coccineum]
MTPRIDLFFDYLKCDGGRVLLGDNGEFKIGVAGELNASVEEKDSLAQVWHKRLGHISEAGLQVLEKQGLFGKKSLGGYWFIFSGSNMKHLESSKSGSIVGTPQQNGLVERMNRTLMDKVPCLLIQSGLPKTFWAEATCTAAYLINRSPATAIEKKTPMEMWSGHPSDYGILRTFGCTDKSVEELQVEVELQGLSNRMPEEDHTDQEDSDDENSGDQETNQAHDLTDYQLVQDREPRARTKPLRFQDESNMTAYAFAAVEEEDTHEPLTYQEAVACEDCSKWKAAMEEEMELGKSRLVARGFIQRPSIDYNEVYSLVVRHTSIWVILALTVCKEYELKQLDVKTTFLRGPSV